VAELRAACAIIFGLYVLSLPYLTLPRVMSMFVAFLVADGALALLCGGLAMLRRQRGVASVVAGLPNLCAGTALLLAPAISLPALEALVGAWATAAGVLGIGAAWRHAGPARFILLAIGAGSIGWAALLCIGCAALGVPFAWWLGAYTIALGIMLLFVAPKLRAEIASPH
jgi:uncharacterized membrane protein HdeD (DUF308 family)